jgi:O-antigen/teichoic acid export membrane protein
MNFRSSIVRLFSGALIDQVVLSGANLLTAVLLVRYTSERTYGLYVLLQSSLLLINTVHGSLICAPLSILAPKKEPEPRREMLVAVQTIQNRLLWPLILVALVATGAGYAWGLMGTTMALVTGISVVSAWPIVQRNFARNTLLVYSRLRDLVISDSWYVAALLLGIVWAAFGFGVPIVWVAVAMAVSSWVGAITAHPSLASGRVEFDGRALWREMRALGFWNFVIALVFWLFARSYSYVLATRLDLTAVAAVNAVRLLVVPAQLMSSGLQNVLVPAASTWFAEVGFDRMVRRLGGLGILVGLCGVIYLWLIWIVRDWVTLHLLHRQIPGRDVLLLLWAAVGIISLVRDVLTPALAGIGQVKPMAYQFAFCALVSILTMWFGIPYWGAPAVLIGLVVGEALNLLGILYLIRKEQVRYRALGKASVSAANS